MNDPMQTNTIEQALRLLGERVRYHTEIEILLVGGAAGMLTNQLGQNRVTTDCDVMVYLPEHAMTAVEQAAEQVAKELELSLTWMNSNVQLRVDALPDGWDDRKQLIGVFGRLRVDAISRPDLIAMKVLAGREQDLEDLDMMRVRRDEIPFVRAYLDALREKGTHQDQIDAAYELLESLDLHDEQ